MSGNNEHNQRWYDKDPILKEALELLRISTDEEKDQAKNFILKMQEELLQEFTKLLQNILAKEIAGTTMIQSCLKQLRCLEVQTQKLKEKLL